MHPYPQRDLTTQAQPIVELVPAEPGLEPFEGGLPPRLLEQISIDVIHDGNWLPSEFLVDRHGRPLTLEQLQPDFVRERDWGAGAVARRLAARLGLEGYLRINVARVLMDFARFPGSTAPGATHLTRYAINYPFSTLLSYQQKKHLLETYYDAASTALEGALRGKKVKIAVHTYDRYNSSGTERPSTSLMTRSIAYQTSSELPNGLFDPVYPDILAEFTCDRILRDRISLTLEKALIPVAHNYPYCLPEGSLEVRYQVWSYFCALRSAFELENPESRGDRGYAMVWEMLLDTNLRSSQSDTLRSYLHMFRRAPYGLEELFARAAKAYGEVRAFSEAQGRNFIEAYRFSPERTSSIALEVRKDLACDLDDDGLPRGLRMDRINEIADKIAEAVIVYFKQDRHYDTSGDPELERHDPWFKDAEATRLV